MVLSVYMLLQKTSKTKIENIFFKIWSSFTKRATQTVVDMWDGVPLSVKVCDPTYSPHPLSTTTDGDTTRAFTNQRIIKLNLNLLFSHLIDTYVPLTAFATMYWCSVPQHKQQRKWLCCMLIGASLCSPAPGLLTRLRQHRAQTWKHTCHVSTVRGYKSMQAHKAHWIYIARLSTEYGLTCRKCVCVCRCVWVCVPGEIWLGNTCSLYWAHIFQSLLYEAKLMQRCTTPHSRVLLRMIKSLPRFLFLTTSFFFPSSSSLSVALHSVPLLLFLSHWFTLFSSNPPSAPTSLSNGNLPVVWRCQTLIKGSRSHSLCFSQTSPCFY